MTAQAFVNAPPLRASNGLLQGQLGATQIRVAFRSGARGKLTPGVYQLFPPMNDPIYGTVVLVAAAPGANQLIDPSSVYAQAAILLTRHSTVPASNSSIKSAILRNRHSAVPGSIQSNLAQGAGAQNMTVQSAIQLLTGSSTSSSSVFVLGQQSIAGQNSIVVSSGFGDLVAALAASGGVTMSVA